MKQLLRSWRQRWTHWWHEALNAELGTDLLSTPSQDSLVVSVSLRISRVYTREEAFRERLKQHHQKRWRNFVRRHWMQQTRRASKNHFIRLVPTIFMTVGSLILANALWPIMSYFLFASPFLQQPKLVSPLPDIPVVRQTHTVPTALAAEPGTLKPKIIRDNLDYTDLSNWFPSQPIELSETEAAPRVEEYIIDIPSLGIERAVVKVGGTNLDSNLIQYPGTADPGSFGAPVIFGHSVLRQFYNPSLKNPRRYMSIFSKIMTLQQGDEIFVEYDGIRYSYSVVKKVEVKPEDVYILEQEYNSRQLKLVTCVPEGTYLRRGVVLAQLETIQ